jgi:hypothetical protein
MGQGGYNGGGGSKGGGNLKKYHFLEY